jgi:NADH-quinone oxidoreductase subunit F
MWSSAERSRAGVSVADGLFGMPTAIHSVKTLCMASWILGIGIEASRSVGTADSPGAWLFCLSGDSAKPGTYEIPFGMTLGELLRLAGGVTGELQAILLGGAPGAFARPEALDLPLTYGSLRQAGLPLGSDVIMVMNQSRDLRRTCWHLARFFAHESFGKCFPGHSARRGNWRSSAGWPKDACALMTWRSSTTSPSP